MYAFKNAIFQSYDTNSFPPLSHALTVSVKRNYLLQAFGKKVFHIYVCRHIENAIAL